MSKKLDLTGQRFGRLVVIEEDVERKIETFQRTGHYRTFWKCRCDCGNNELKTVNKQDLLKGKIKSCGCLYNKNTYYEHEDGYMVCKDIKGLEFIFDKEDFELVSNHTWSIQKQLNCNYYHVMGYVIINNKKVTTRLHRVLMNVWDANIEVDHINRNPLDNRRQNLRIANDVEQSINRGKKSNNTSGITGVNWHKHRQRWYSTITVNKKCISLGYYHNKDDAIKARLKAELKYFGEFSPQKYLFQQFNINIMEANNEI